MYRKLYKYFFFHKNHSFKVEVVFHNSFTKESSHWDGWCPSTLIQSKAHEESWVSLQAAAQKEASILKWKGKHCTSLPPLDLLPLPCLWLQCFLLKELLNLHLASWCFWHANKGKSPTVETLTVAKPRHYKAVLLKASDAGQVTPFPLTRGQSFFPSFGLPEYLVTVIYIQYPSIWASNRPNVT